MRGDNEIKTFQGTNSSIASNQPLATDARNELNSRKRGKNISCETRTRKSTSISNSRQANFTQTLIFD